MGLMNINGMGDMFEMYGTKEMMDMKVKYPRNLSPIGSPGPFGVIEMGGMFTIFKVRDNLTSYVDPGWYQHPPGTVAEAVDVDDIPQNIRNQANQSMQNSPHNAGSVSWFSQDEEKKQQHNQDSNWMRSTVEDSMGGHMHGMKGMKGMSPQNADDQSNMKDMQHMEH